jgi:antitoxin VapB
LQLNINNREAHRLARELASLTGESLTEAVITALRERLERERRRCNRNTVARRLMAIGRRYASFPDADCRDPEEILGYDENGLPT